MKYLIKNKEKGTITPALLIIASAFIIALYGLLFILALQFDFSQRQVASDKALNIAEAGVNYYRWHLIQDPDDFQDGTGVPGPYIHDYTDPQGDIVGQFSLEITPATNSNPTVTIKSTGYTQRYSKIKRTIKAQYGRVSLTRFAFLHNSNLWFGNDITVNGPVFSNGGIRQDGTNTSTVESAKQTYTCGVETGCSSPTEKPGIWGNGDIESLWDYPVPPIDFDSIKVDFTNMRTAAQNEGVYLAPSSAQGYHVVFSDDGTFTVYRVTGVSAVLGYSLEDDCESLNQVITSQVELATYSVSDNPIIFIEDTTWVEGTVNGKTTLVAARFPVGSYETNIWVVDDLKYLDRNGGHRLGIISQNDIVMGIYIPEKFEINGAILAQNGRVIRHHYNYFGCRSGGQGRHSQKNEFNFFGSLISNQRSYWNFSSGPGSPASGFVKSTLDYDSNLFYDPPPYFPTSGTYEFLSWSEE